MLRTFMHDAGPAPCGQAAFIGPLDLLEHSTTPKPVVAVDFSTAAIQGRQAVTTHLPCSSCGRLVTRAEVSITDVPERHVARYLYTNEDGAAILDRRTRKDRRRHGKGGRRAIDFGAPGGPGVVNIADIAQATGIHRHTIREMCESRELPGALRVGRQGVWKIPFVIARDFVLRVTGRNLNQKAS